MRAIDIGSIHCANIVGVGYLSIIYLHISLSHLKNEERKGQGDLSRKKTSEEQRGVQLHMVLSPLSLSLPSSVYECYAN
jgi:hypothetical protein